MARREASSAAQGAARQLGATRAGRAATRFRAAGRQLTWALLTLVVISVVTFAAVNVGRSPEDLARQSLGRQVTDRQLNSYIERNDLDDALVVRYGRWLGDFVRGDWGFSVVTQREVRGDIVPRLEKSFILAMASLLISLPIALALGVYMALRWGSFRDLSLGFLVVAVSALPEFVVGIGLLFVFSTTLGLLPPISSGISFGGFGSQVEAYVLPTMTLVLVSIPYIARVTRAAAREALAAPYTRAAVLRGLGRRTVIWDQAMRNAAVPIVNAVAINLVYLLGGVIVVENLFGFPGIGQALVQAIGHADAITVQAIGLVMGAMFIAISLIADLWVIYFNPRLKAAAVS